MTSNINTTEHEDSIETFNDNDRRHIKQMKENKLKDVIHSFNDNNTTPDRCVDTQQIMLDRYDLDGDGKLNISEQQNIGNDMLRLEDISKMLKKGLIFVSVLAVGLMISNIGTVYFVVWLTKDVKVSSDGVMKNMNGGNVKTEGIAPKVTLYEVSEGGTRHRLKKSKRAIHRKLQDEQGSDGSNTAIEGYLDEQGVSDVLDGGSVQFLTDNGMQSCEVTGFENKKNTDYTLYTTCGTGTLVELQEEESQQGGEGIRQRKLGSENKSFLSINQDSNNDDQQGLKFSIFRGHACALFSEEVQCVGHNFYGQLGIGDTEYRFFPYLMLGLENKTPLQVVTGRFHTCVLVNENNGSVYCVGGNINGLLGDVTTDNAPSTELVQVKKEGKPLTNVKQIAAGPLHNCAILGDDSLYCWGLSTENQLGFNNGVGTNVKFMALSGTRTCIVTSSLYYYESLVQCTNPDSSGIIDTIDFGNDIFKLAASYNHFCALLEGGTAKCFGENYWGQLGNGSTSFLTYWNPDPQSVLVDAIGSVLSGITDINAGWDSTCVVADGEPMCFGRNDNYQLGIDNTDSNNVLNDKVLYPTRVPVELPNKELVSVHVGRNTGHAVFSDNSVYAWGTNDSNNRWSALGDGSNHRIFGDVRAARMKFIFNWVDWW